MQSVVIGSSTHSSGGHVHQRLRDVEFRAELLGSYSEPELCSGSPNRGTVYTLYCTAAEALVVHVTCWTHWQGETETFRLYSVTISDLQIGGEFEDLGNACGYGRPLTLAEAIEQED